MTSLTQIDIEADSIEHWMPLRSSAASGIETSVLPDTIRRMFSLDSDLAAVSVEYLAHSGGNAIDVTVPILFWRHDEDGAHPETLPGLSESLLWEIGPALMSSDPSSQHSLLPNQLYRCAPSLVGTAQTRRLLGVYMRDVSFFMPSDLGSGLEDIDGEMFTSRRELSQIMSKVVGQAWYLPAVSNHEQLLQRNRLDHQARIFDAIFLEQTGIVINTNFDPSLKP
jgi:hypothetical protein